VFSLDVFAQISNFSDDVDVFYPAMGVGSGGQGGHGPGFLNMVQI